MITATTPNIFSLTPWIIPRTACEIFLQLYQHKDTKGSSTYTYTALHTHTHRPHPPSVTHPHTHRIPVKADLSHTSHIIHHLFLPIHKCQLQSDSSTPSSPP
ncbi:uncharacterized protein LAJ45_10759 [Morchella importuna]|uniref:uncharacterized protein n=1 Tax=Morchella importuna TaxID=1174673 RepID=UPI001E8EA68B|nr:uncharacterized protein LAJ45_10759 [Morchella importuna]KAH8145199.1 hypothetical protein LAJ45_10759 [Morchella importuna]